MKHQRNRAEKFKPLLIDADLKCWKAVATWQGFFSLRTTKCVLSPAFYLHQSQTTCHCKWLSDPGIFKTVVLNGCRSNMCPENSTANNHDFQMNCFEETTTCKACSMMLRFIISLALSSSFCSGLFKERLVCWGWISPFVFCRGIFFQGYLCTRCKMAAHKECLGRVPACGRNSGLWTCMCTYALLPISVIIIDYHNFLLFSSNYRSCCYFEEGEICDNNDKF